MDLGKEEGMPWNLCSTKQERPTRWKCPRKDTLILRFSDLTIQTEDEDGVDFWWLFCKKGVSGDSTDFRDFLAPWISLAAGELLFLLVLLLFFTETLGLFELEEPELDSFKFPLLALLFDDEGVVIHPASDSDVVKFFEIFEISDSCSEELEFFVRGWNSLFNAE